MRTHKYLRDNRIVSYMRVFFPLWPQLLHKYPQLLQNVCLLSLPLIITGRVSQTNIPVSRERPLKDWMSIPGINRRQAGWYFRA